jgi:hypothetical protein
VRCSHGFEPPGQQRFDVRLGRGPGQPLKDLLEPYAYLRRVFEEIPKAATLAEIELLLPHRIELRPSAVVES